MDTIHHASTHLDRLKPLLEELDREAYQRGWDDAVQHIMAAAKHAPVSPALVHPYAQTPLVLRSPPPPERPIIDVVKDLVKASPGLRGTGIVDAVHAGNPTKDRKSLDRTIRTALMRLKKRHVVESRNGGWYSKEAA